MRLDGPEVEAQILGWHLQHVDHEHFVYLMLDVKKQVIGIHTVSVGSLFAAIVSPREFIKAAIFANAAVIIVAHLLSRQDARVELRSRGSPKESALDFVQSR